MNKVLIIQNDPPETLGLYESFLREHSDLTLIKAYQMKPQDEFPSVHQFSHFIIGPTPISANDALNHEFLRKEWKYLEEIVDSGKPCLGVCCGGQMLAKLLGGEVTKSPSKEIGGYTVNLTSDSLSDPLYCGFPEAFPVFHWHSDMFTVPPGGKLLATGNPCPIQSFRKDNIWGIIFHLEVTAVDAMRWADAYPDEPQAIGKTSEQVLAECRSTESQMKTLAVKLMKNFLSQK
ncbi:MAG: type 1 glutamine amidotransferase [Candidatus Bathyarchaeota archaeon]|nr:type 1 glutamine amidotransferase [Candidatus Bathyarchaeota archaeon]